NKARRPSAIGHQAIRKAVWSAAGGSARRCCQTIRGWRHLTSATPFYRWIMPRGLGTDPGIRHAIRIGQQFDLGDREEGARRRHGLGNWRRGLPQIGALAEAIQIVQPATL